MDRSPDPKGVIDRIIWLRKHGGREVITLMGNHEALMLGALRDLQPDVMQMFLLQGGKETLESNGRDL